MKSNSRLVNAEMLPDAVKYPILLSENSWITFLIVKDIHENLSHYAGVNHILSKLTRRYWLKDARQMIGKVANRCLFCKRRLGSKGMAPLPTFKLSQPLRPFAKTAVDFAGPLITIQGRGRARQKRYLCLFTCIQCRSVHLELAYGLDTDAFIRAFKWFTNKRGRP